ncbi:MULTISPECIES: ABC transporter ATP-binding protein [Microbacterium]|uniref:Peptide ABC transporter ATP-binding protein n=1 Tax=Microbacterium testaceum TaxID=2033 RepID=A0A147F9T6_MICTE|nr:ABC transporter ATP-binding protein [Microbacterium testaceum]KTS06567.1 peptide ABC transporter ATP-binding protein [Microbacterium testaceum]KTS13269.1 peptide ABC transporter ATP-binding protein [Microbacterium testaceum]KTS70121.1 peptide ABC transporter ATP-binding protein [Microbacterium testaceum]KTS92090.1 peptide ABC transporter ATP-binding protein [Microbacterium testaceum]
MSAPLLQVSDLSITADTEGGRYDAVRSVDFELDRGQALAVVGESGSGKSLTALAIAGLLGEKLTPTGSVRFDDRELIGMGAADRRAMAGRRIGFVFQEPMSSLHPILTVGQQLEEGLRAHFDMTRRQRADRVRELLDIVGLGKARDIRGDRIGQLSGGMRQRVMIAMAISCEPELVIADEPTTALDVTLQRQVIDLLGSLRERLGLALMLITHDLGVVAETCDEAVVMYGGQVVESGPTATLLHDPAHDYTRALLMSIPVLGDDRPRLPTVASIAPWLRDARQDAVDLRPVTELVTVAPGHRVRRQAEGVAV